VIYEDLQVITSIFNNAINYEQYNKAVIEYLIAFLCVIKGFTENIDTQLMFECCLRAIFHTEYKHYALDYAIDLLKGNQRVLINNFGKKKTKQETILEYLYRLSSLSTSKFGANNLDLVWNKDKNANIWSKKFDGKLYIGAIGLLNV